MFCPVLSLSPDAQRPELDLGKGPGMDGARATAHWRFVGEAQGRHRWPSCAMACVSGADAWGPSWAWPGHQW